MAYVPGDPRSSLGGGGRSGSDPLEQGGTAEFVKFYENPAQERDALQSTWYARAQHFVVAYSEAQDGAVLSRRGQADESMVILPSKTSDVEIATGTESVSVRGASVVVIPPGNSEIRVRSGGQIVRMFSTAAEDLAEMSANASSYQQPKPRVAAFREWPQPPGGLRVRSYPLEVAPDPARFGRIWRCSTMMVNYTEPRLGPRDVKRMSPHSHDDFEQGSLVLSGSFVHHIRWPWTTDQREWRHDEHEICAGPSLAVIPPGSIHTSQQVGPDVNQLVDLFGPPRWDFSKADGWVLNADDYPIPEDEEGS